jgi:hypothetical protein
MLLQFTRSITSVVFFLFRRSLHLYLYHILLYFLRIVTKYRIKGILYISSGNIVQFLHKLVFTINEQRIYVHICSSLLIIYCIRMYSIISYFSILFEITFSQNMQMVTQILLLHEFTSLSIYLTKIKISN